ncbi:MAG: hypothetical protein AB7E47_16800 [Desulfovibrionaceae bacterium]
MNRLHIIPALFTLTACAKTGYLLFQDISPATAAGAMTPCVLYLILLSFMFKEKRWAYLVLGTLLAISGTLQAVGGIFGVWDQMWLRVVSALLGIVFVIGGVAAITKAPAKQPKTIEPPE